MSDAEDKTEEATPEKRRKARDEGQFARGRDSAATAASLAVIAVLALTATHLVELLSTFMIQCLTNPYPSQDWSDLIGQTLATLGRLVLPCAAAAATAAIAVGVAEAGFHPNFELLAPKWERLDPIAKLKNLFSPTNALVSTVLSLLRVFAVSLVAYSVTKDSFSELLRIGQANLAAGTIAAVDAALRLAVWSSLALALLAAADYAYNVFKHNKQLRMSRQELKDEMKQAEGNPEMRARRRMRARELVNKGLAKQVRESDVVVVNPTHFAVALRYRPSDGAPVVAAKGVDDVALQIRKLAGDYDVTIVENKPLARALVASARVGRAIPLEFYTAVAEVLAFVYRVRGRGLTA